MSMIKYPSEIPVLSYEHRSPNRKETQLDENETPAAADTGNSADMMRKASPLMPDVAARLPSTLQKFTMHEKVAVITG